MWCVVACDLESSRKRRPWPTGGGGCRVKNKQTRVKQRVQIVPSSQKIGDLSLSTITGKGTENRIMVIIEIGMERVKFQHFHYINTLHDPCFVNLHNNYIIINT